MIIFRSFEGRVSYTRLCGMWVPSMLVTVYKVKYNAPKWSKMIRYSTWLVSCLSALTQLDVFDAYYCTSRIVSNEGSDETVHMHSLVRAFAARIQKVWKLIEAQTNIRYPASLVSCAYMFEYRCYSYSIPKSPSSQAKGRSLRTYLWRISILALSMTNWKQYSKQGILFLNVLHWEWLV